MCLDPWASLAPRYPAVTLDITELTAWEAPMCLNYWVFLAFGFVLSIWTPQKSLEGHQYVSILGRLSLPGIPPPL